MIPSMDNPLLSQLVNGISSSIPQSRLYSSWSVCDEESKTPAIADCLNKSARYTFGDSEKRADVLGLMSGLPEDTNKADAVTDWDSLSRLFPPLWAASDSQDPPVYVPSVLPRDFSPVIGSQTYSEPARNLPDIESLQRGFEDLGLLDPLVPSTGACSPLLDDVFQDHYYENQALDPNSSFKPIERPNQPNDGYVKFIGRDCGTNGASVCPGPQNRAKEFSGLPRPVWKNDKGRGKFNRGSPTGQTNYSPGVREAWGKEAFTKSSSDFPPVGMKPPAFQFNQPFPKNHGFQSTAQRTQYKERSENNFFSSFPKVGNFDCHENIASQKEPYAKSPIPMMKPNEGFSPSGQGPRWLDGDLLGSQKSATSPLPSPASSSLSDGSPTHISGYFSQPALPPSAKEGQLNGTNNQMAFSGFNDENQRRNKCFSRTSPSKEAMYRNAPLGCPPNWSPPQQGSGHNGNSERLHKLSKRVNSAQNNGNAERRGRRPWNVPPGNFRQNPPPCSPLQRKQEANLGNVSDFINASLLPPFSLMSDLKQNQNFPPFNPQVFSPPTNMPFPPPFPFSDLIDLFHYEDINQIHPFISDLFCGDIPPPYFPLPAPFNRYRPSRNRSGPANELHLQLEECCEQWRALEKERKKTEADLARNFPGNRVSSSYSSTVPTLPANPSRVDRLVVDQLREHARGIALVKIMERICGESLHVNIALALEHHLEAIHLTQARRKDEIINAANRQKQGSPRYNNERDVLALAAAMKEMVSSTRKARTALWCSLQMTLSKSSAGITVKPEDLERALQELCPNKTPGTEAEPRSGVSNGGRE